MQRPLTPETIDAIIDYLHSDRHSLFACSLTARQWLPSTRYHIFSQIHLRPTNIRSFVPLVEAPTSSLPFMMRHLLINGFSKSLVLAADPKAVERLRRVAPLLREVKYMHLCNSSEVPNDLLSAIGSIHTLTIAQMIYHCMDDVLALVYSLPLLKCLSIKALTVMNPAVKEYKTSPGPVSAQLSSFEIGDMKADSYTCSGFANWLVALDPMLSIRTMHLKAYDAEFWPFQKRQLRLVGSSIRSIHVDMDVEVDVDVDMGAMYGGMERSPAFVKLEHCTNLRAVRLENIDYEYDYGNAGQAGRLCVRKLISQIPSQQVEEISFSFWCIDDKSLKEFDWIDIVEFLGTPQFSKLRMFEIEICRYTNLSCGALFSELRTNALSVLEARGILHFRVKRLRR